MNGSRGVHPGGEELLRFADGEVSGREAKRIQSHLAACWRCRTALTELQQTIGECVHYRDAVLHPSLPEPPAPWFDIYRRLDEVDASERRRALLPRLREAFQGFAGQPRRWAPAIALLVVAALIVDQFRNAPSVKAAELLQKAAVAEAARPSTPRRIQIKTESRKVARVIGAANAAASPQDLTLLAGLRPLFERANYNWDDPLSAVSFARWRNSLAEKRDQVTRVEEAAAAARYRIQTTTNSSELVEATLDLTIADLQPVESTLRFRGAGVIELAALADIAPRTERAEVVRPDFPAPRERAPSQPQLDPGRPATPGEELRVLSVLHRLGADLGEPVEVTRSGSQVLVTGVGVSPALGEQIHDELTGMPRVSVRFRDPAPSSEQTPSRPLESVSLRPEIARLQNRLESAFGGRAGLEQFTDEVLGSGDELMSRAHALRRLAERFPDDIESQLTAEERALLAKLRREHAVAIAGLAAAIEKRTRPAFIALGAGEAPSRPPLPNAGSWQAATEELFQEARAAESLLAAMLGGAAAGAAAEDLPGRAFGSVVRLRARAAEYVRNSLE